LFSSALRPYSPIRRHTSRINQLHGFYQPHELFHLVLQVVEFGGGLRRGLKRRDLVEMDESSGGELRGGAS
jgi:hypothetical protein